ncbi:MAG: radical SAM protein [Armatimonadota bacterium]|nr:radical SAM protein [Armatimonadota bacterium]
MQDSTFVIPIIDKWLIYSPLHHLAALLNGAAVSSLRESNSRRLPESLASIKRAIEAEPARVPSPNSGPARPQFVGVIPTRACNLKCVYCGFGASSCPDRTMDLDTAVALVDWWADYAKQSGIDTLEIHFFGGEPLCAPDVVSAVVHHARRRAAEAGLAARFEIATNGCFDDDSRAFLSDYIDSVVLSLDGKSVYQDRYRPTSSGAGTFEAVAANARRLAASSTELCVRTCVTAENAKDLQESTAWMCEELNPSSIDYEVLQPTPESDAAGLAPPDPWEFATAFIRASRVAAEAGVRAVYSAASTDELRHSFCPVGTDTIIASPDGRLSACYLLEEDWQSRGIDLNVGTVDAANGVKLDQSAVERVRALTGCADRCRKCFVRRHCAGGCHVNHSYPGHPDRYDDFCVQTRLIAACRLVGGLVGDEQVDRLLSDRTEMERLALRASDTLEDWDGAAT